MQKQFFRVMSRIVLLCVLLSTLSIVVVHAWNDYDYFDAVYACDDNYFDTLDACRQLPFYPISPDEGDCRYSSGNNFVSCLNGIPSPAFELDFCAMARAANDSCIATYGPDSGNTDLGAMMDCRTASGIDQCQ
jgi:hypothetical protein